MGSSLIFRLALCYFILLASIPVIIASNQTVNPDDNRLNQLENRISTIEEKQERNWSSILNFFDKLLEAIYGLPVYLVREIFTVFVLHPLGFDEEGKVWGVYQEIFTLRPDFSPLEGAVNEFSRELLSVYVLAFIIYSMYVLYAGVVGRAELKESLLRIIIGAILLVNSYYIYNLLIDLFNALTLTFTSYIDYSILNLNTSTFITNIDVITILIVFSIILGQLLGVAVLLIELIGLWLFPLIIVSLSMPFQKLQNFGETLLNILVGIMLAPTVSSIALAIIPAALKTTSGLSSIIINRLILLCGILLAIVLPLILILAVTFRPMIKVVAVYKLMKLKVVK